MAKKLDTDAKKAEIIAYLKANGPKMPKDVKVAIGVDVEVAKVLVKELIDAGKIRANKDNVKLLEAVPVKKKDAPVAKSTTAAKKKAKAAPVEDDDEEDEDEEEEEDEEDDGYGSDDDEDEEEEEEDEDESDEDEEESDDDPEEEEDEEEDDPEEEDEVDDDEDDEPAPAKKPAGKGRTKAPVPATKFAIAFKPIDTLTDAELTKRVNEATEAAESAAEEGFKEVAEMLMRSVARARKQLSKRGIK